MAKPESKSRAYDAAYYQRNKERILARNAAYRLDNRKRIHAQRLTTREKRLAWQRTYNASHKGQSAGQQAKRSQRAIHAEEENPHAC